MKSLLLFLMLCSSLVANSQFSSGKIVYNISMKDSLGNSLGIDDIKSAEYITENILRIDQNSRMGTQTTLVNYADSSYHILFDMAGTKIAVVMPKEVFATPDSLKPSIKYKCKSKKIAGQKCKLALISYPGEPAIEVYYAKKIPGKLNQKFVGLKGYPMEFNLQHQGVTEHYKANEVDISGVSKDYLSIPNDYRKMSLEEFQKALSE